ncbi:MAG: hypothetical protein AAF802_03120 [Planctomycetota bacterium]
MGTDIHAFIEYDLGEDIAFSDLGDVQSFNNGELFMRADYLLFDRLAGARAHSVELEYCEEMMFQPRGLPEHCSDAVVRRFHVAIESRVNESMLEIPVPLVPVAKQVEFLASAAPAILYDSDQLFPNPYWHSASWLTLAEVMEVKDVHGDANPEFNAMLTLMQSLEHDLGFGRSRLVFWFDN